MSKNNLNNDNVENNTPSRPSTYDAIRKDFYRTCCWKCLLFMFLITLIWHIFHRSLKSIESVSDLGICFHIWGRAQRKCLEWEERSKTWCGDKINLVSITFKKANRIPSLRVERVLPCSNSGPAAFRGPGSLWTGKSQNRALVERPSLQEMTHCIIFCPHS